MKANIQSEYGAKAQTADRRTHARWRYISLLVAVVFVSAGIRLGCSFNDLWLDELWSLRNAINLKSVTQIFSIATDNNHPLNTLYLYLLGDGKASWEYRLFACVAGSAAVLLAGLLGGLLVEQIDPKRSPAAKWIGTLVGAALMGGSYFFIHYSSEARGYAPAVFFSYFAIYSLWRGQDKTFVFWTPLYWIAAFLALLSHTGSAEILLACGIWSIIFALSKIADWSRRMLFLICWQAVPAASAAWIYLAFLRHVKNGAGPVSSVTEVLSGATAYTLGLPISLGEWIGIPAAILVVVIALIYLARKKEWALSAFFFVGIFTAVIPIFWRPENMQLFPRYFILNFALVLPLLTLLVQRLFESGSYCKIAASAAIIFFVLGNAVHVRALLTYGRGEYKKAVLYIAEHSAPGEITVGGDNDFRNFMVLGYYEQSIHPEHWFGFYKFGTADLAGPQWLLINRRDGQPPPDPEKPGPLGPQYRMAHAFRHSALSGFDWYIYRNIYLTN